MRTIIINCSNLHVGGGLAVASSFIDYIARDFPAECNYIYLILSSKCFLNLANLNTNLSCFSGYTVFDSRPRTFVRLSQLLFRLKPTILFTVFGPTYAIFPRKTFLISGVANPFLLFPNNEYIYSLHFLLRFYLRLYYLVPSLFLYRANYLICETSQAKKSLMDRFPLTPFSIVSSGFHDIYLRPESWSEISHPKLNAQSLKLGIIAHNYPHKNLKVLQPVLALLRETYSLRVDIFVTVSPSSFAKISSELGPSLTNLGNLVLSQCPSFYAKMDGVIFPSLLESFSAVTLESLIMKRPLFISNIPFVNEPCGGHCIEIDPLNPQNIAEAIFEFFTMPEFLREEHTEKAYKYAHTMLNSAHERASSYLDIIHRCSHG